MNKKLMATLLLGGLVVAWSGCNKNEPDEPTVEKTGDFLIEFDYEWAMAGAPFELGTMLYHPMTGDSLKFDTFRHYVGHVELQSTDGTWWSDPEAYGLLDLADPNTLSFRVTDIPEGDYTTMRITLGVDSAHNVSGAQSGALDPANGMFWNWNTGYIMVKAEGESPNSPTGFFAYHLGGFSGPGAVQTQREFALADHGLLTVREDALPVTHFVANPARLFHNYGTVENGPNIHMPSTDAGIMGQDFHGAVYLDHIHP